MPRSVGNSMFQFLAGGKPSWLFKFDDFEGFFLQREFDYQRTPVAVSYTGKNKWNDIVIRVVHSTKSRGRFTVWRNGRQVYDHKGQTTRKVSSKHKPYFKFGIYNTGFNKKGAPINGGGFRDGEGLLDLVLYYDEVRSAASCDGLKLGDLGYDCSKLLN